VAQAFVKRLGKTAGAVEAETPKDLKKLEVS